MPGRRTHIVSSSWWVGCIRGKSSWQKVAIIKKVAVSGRTFTSGRIAIYERENRVMQTKSEDLTLLAHILREDSFETDRSDLR